MGLTQLQMAEKLHVDPKVVESLEGERFEALGAPVFVRGHLKRYAEFIGENAGQLIEIYTGGAQSALPDLRRMPRAASDNKPSKLAVPALLVLIAFVLLGVFWWILQSVRSTSEIRPAPNAREVPVEPDFSSPISADDGTPGVQNTPGTDGAIEGASGAAGAATSAAVASAGATRAPDAASSSTTTSGGAPSAAGAAATASSSNTGARNASGTTDTAPTPSATVPAAGSATYPAKPMQVTLKFTADSWVEVYDSKGEKLFYDIGSADSQKTLTGTPPFRVTFGNAPGVSFDVDGKPATIPGNALKDDTAQFVINPSGRIVRARTQSQGPQASGSPQRAAAPPEGT
jgi:cytoskeleton protein RodZ